METNNLVASERESDAVVGLLSLAHPRVSTLHERHLAVYGRLLPTVFLAEVARFSLADVIVTPVVDCVNWLLITGSPAVRNVLLTGFVEGVPSETDEAGIDCLPDPLRSEIRRDLGLQRT